MLLGEDRSDGKKLRYFYDSEGMCGFRYYNGSAWTEYVYVKNAKGDVLAILSADGTAVANYSYDAWGNCTVESQTGGMGDINPIRYRGYYYDGETGLYYLLTRYYDPAIGHFISPDGFEYLDPETIGAINLYAYCLNNPVMGYDPDGTLDWWQKLLIGAAFILVGAAVTAATAGTGTGLLAAFGAALLTSAKAVAVSTAISAGIGFVVGGISSGSFDGAVAGLLNGAVDGFMWGGIFAGGSQILSAGFKGLAKLGIPTGRKGGIAGTGILSPDKLRSVEDISKIAQRGQAFYDYGGTILKFGKYAHVDVSTKSLLHLHLWFTRAHLPLGTILAGFIGGF